MQLRKDNNSRFRNTVKGGNPELGSECSIWRTGGEKLTFGAKKSWPKEGKESEVKGVNVDFNPVITLRLSDMASFESPNSACG